MLTIHGFDFKFINSRIDKLLFSIGPKTKKGPLCSAVLIVLKPHFSLRVTAQQFHKISPIFSCSILIFHETHRSLPINLRWVKSPMNFTHTEHGLLNFSFFHFPWKMRRQMTSEYWYPCNPPAVSRNSPWRSLRQSWNACLIFRITQAMKSAFRSPDIDESLIKISDVVPQQYRSIFKYDRFNAMQSIIVPQVMQSDVRCRSSMVAPNFQYCYSWLFHQPTTD